MSIECIGYITLIASLVLFHANALTGNCEGSVTGSKDTCFENMSTSLLQQAFALKSSIAQGHEMPAVELQVPEGSIKFEEKEYHFVPHHKSGTFMVREAADKMRKTLSPGSAPYGSIVKIDSSSTMGLALNTSMMQTPGPSCFAQLARNPFEMLISGYLYHSAASEPWLRRSFGEVQVRLRHGCKPVFTGGRMSQNCHKDKTEKSSFKIVKFWHYRGIDQVFQASQPGSTYANLPQAYTNETFPAYLKRVGLDAGLIAEFIWASENSLAPMRFTYDYVKSHSCSVNMCLNEFYENCGAAWQRVLTGWQIPEPQKSTLFRAATRSCPEVSSAEALEHSSHFHMQRANLTHQPPQLMVEHLRELDRHFLNGTIAALEEHVGCRVRGIYKGPL